MKKRTIVLGWTICLLAAVFYAYDYFLRVSPSVMIHPLMVDFKVSTLQIGLLSAFYYYAYTPLQIPSGIMVDKYKTRYVLTCSVLLCAIGALIFSSIFSFSWSLFARLLMGAGSAFALSAGYKLAARWLPHRHFALYSGLLATFGTIGAVLADTLLSRMVHEMGWVAAMRLSSYFGFILAIITFLVVRNQPSTKKKSKKPTKALSWKGTWVHLITVIKQPGFWVTGIVACIMYLPINVLASLWGVAYLIQTSHIEPAKAATITSLLFVGTAIGSPLSGWFSDFIKSRRIPIMIGLIATTIIISIVIFVPNVNIPTICILNFLLGFSVGPEILVFAIAREISLPQATGVSTAAMNFSITIGAAIFQPFLGYLLQQTWNGAKTAQGIPIFSANDYRAAFTLLPVLLVIAIFMSFFIPKTQCRPLKIKRTNL